MTLLQAFLLGIIQGVTEFIPVSSTAHLLIGQSLLQIPASQAVFSFLVIIQLGTILALFLFFWNEIRVIIRAFIQGILDKKPFATHNSLVGWLVIVATIPGLIVGFLLKDFMDALFSDPILTAGIRLTMSAVLLGFVEYFGQHRRPLQDASWMDALVVGIFQILSIFPGASRSGSTIAGAIVRGFDRPSAARLAFLMSMPIMLAAGGYETLLVIQMDGTVAFLPHLMIGLITAAIVGWFSIKWLLGFLQKHSLYIFAGYCLVVGLICLWIGLS